MFRVFKYSPCLNNVVKYIDKIIVNQKEHKIKRTHYLTSVKKTALFSDFVIKNKNK